MKTDRLLRLFRYPGQTLEVELIPAAEWAEQKGNLPSAPEVEQGKERFVTEALTEDGIPVLVDRKIAGKEENEPLPPYEVLALTVPVSSEKFPIKEGTSVWVESKMNRVPLRIQRLHLLQLDTKSVTRFEKVKGEGFQRK